MNKKSVLIGALILPLAACGQSDEKTAAENNNATAIEQPAIKLSGEAAAGKTLFNRCASCHSVDKGGRNGIGPNLFGIFGRKIASDDGYRYSTALPKKIGNWDEGNLDQFLTRPAKFAPGTKMAFAGLSKAEDRQAMIAYLAALK